MFIRNVGKILSCYTASHLIKTVIFILTVMRTSNLTYFSSVGKYSTQEHHSSTLKMEATCSSETSVRFYHATRRRIPEVIFIVTAIIIPNLVQLDCLGRLLKKEYLPFRRKQHKVIKHLYQPTRRHFPEDSNLHSFPPSFHTLFIYFLSLLHVVQTGSGAHPASYPLGTGGSFPGG
jgi:hypothetical protein